MGFLKRVPVRLRITMGLVGLMVGSLLMASALGFFPNEQKEILNGRAKLCETLAITSTGMASSGQLGTLKASLEAVVNRDNDVLSIGLRTINNELVVAAGSHNDHWRADHEIGVDQNKVPVFRRGEKWGHLEVCFADTGGVLGLNYWAPAWLLIVMVPALFIQYSIFLRKTLKHLDPSAGVPQHVQDALDTLTVGLLLLDGDNQIIYANRKFAESIGRDSNEIDGLDPSELGWLIPSNGDPELPWIKAAVTSGPVDDQLLQMIVEHRRKTFSINCSKVGNGKMAIFDDITLLEEAREAAQQASESKSSFLANMSHEIRTPLNAVLGFTDVLRRGLVTDTDESLDHLNMIHRSGKHLLRLINDILDLSKIEAGKMDVESIDTQLSEIIVDTVDVLGVRAREKDLELNIEFLSSIPETIQSDPTRLRQIITNLIGNAIKFTDQGSVTVATEMIDGKSPQLNINIVDTGVGMTPEQQAKIFDSFSQADETTTRKFGGTGLGLSISRQLTEALGGELSVSSEPSVGSTFTVHLPLDPANLEVLVTPESILAARESSKSSETLATIRLPSKPILVVDDGEANRRLIELVLTRAGARVVTAENGLQAIEKVSEQDFDLIFMDMQMPIVDGYTATKRLRQAGMKTPIVALTGNAMMGDRERCIDAGCDDFLTKPVDIDRLLERTAHFIGYGKAEPLTKNEFTSVSQSSVNGSDLGANASPELADPGDDTTVSMPIHSTLPMDDEDFREIVADFVQRLDSRLDGIESAIDAADFDHVRSEAHWLKGAGGTVGFAAFSDPATALERAAKDDDYDSAVQILKTIHQLHQRIVVPGMTRDIQVASDMDPSRTPGPDSEVETQQGSTVSSATGPAIPCTLPFDDAELVAIVHDYIKRLDIRLMKMEQLCNSGHFDELASEAHWLKGSGGTVGYPALQEPAAALEQAAKRGSATQALESLQAVIHVRERLLLPDPTAVV